MHFSQLELDATLVLWDVVLETIMKMENERADPANLQTLLPVQTVTLGMSQASA
jgi:hypothetical protein